MFRKVLAIVLTSLVIGLIIAGIIFLRKKNVAAEDIYKAVPNDAAVLFECTDITQLANSISNAPIFIELTRIHTIRRIYNGILYLDSLKQNNTIIQPLFHNNTLLISLHTTGKNNCNVLFYIKLNEKGQDKKLIQLLSETTSDKGSISERKYDHTKIYDFTSYSKNKPGDFSFTSTNGIFILSYSSLLLENAIRQTATNENIKKQKGFEEVKFTAGKYVDGNIYINYKYISRLISILLTPSKSTTLFNLPRFANWTELDCKIKTNTLLFNGFTFSDDSANYYLNLFLKQAPQKTTIDAIVPSSIAAFVFLGIEDNLQFRSDYKKYLTKSGNIAQYNNDINQINTLIDDNIEEIFNTILHKEIAYIVTSNNEKNAEDNSFVLIHTYSRNETRKRLINIIKKTAGEENKKLADYTYTYRIDAETTYEIYAFPIHNICKVLFGNVFNNTENKYFTLIDNDLVFSSSVKSLSDFIYMNLLHKTLSTDPKYVQFTEYLSNKTNLFFYSNIDNGYSFIAPFLNDEYLSEFELHFELFKKFQAVACQFNSNNDMIFTNIAFEYFPEYREDPHTVWESLLDTVAEFKPKLVINHNTNDKEICIQDLKHNIYLINKAGRILWKVPLSENIMSDIYQIDFYENSKLQFLFSTKRYLHLIDRNGNYVERYPVKLRSPATNGMSLFDYENNKDYRICIAGEDRNIYMYNKEGNILSGWEFEGTEHFVLNNVQHFRVNDKDYIVCTDKNRIYILDRRGNIRVPLQSSFSKSAYNILILEPEQTNTKARLVTTDTLGKIYYIYLDGKIEKVNLGNYSSHHYFDYQDVDADGLKDFIFLDKNKLLVMNQNKNLIFDYQFKEDIQSPPIYYHFSQHDRKLGVVSQKSNTIYLFSKDGSIYKGFPLKGYTPFSIGIFHGNANNFNLVVGSSDGFLYNYSVQ